jgi:hypothetical protein
MAMIRRHLADRMLLFTQHDHALLSGALAAHYGNARFAPPHPRDPTITAVSLHDCGWPLHDDHPTLNADRLPTDVFESPIHVATKVWSATTDRVADQHPYAQLLVSLHVLGLSGFASGHVHTRHDMFALNQFQQREVERQEILRRELDLSTDIPLRLGLADKSADVQEEQLRRNHFILQTMDRISLALLCSTVLFPRIDNIVPRPGAVPVGLSFARTGDFELKVDPWPFDRPQLTFPISFRPLPPRPFRDESHLHQAYADAPLETVSVTVHS